MSHKFLGTRAMEYRFRVYSYYPEEYRLKFYSLLDKEKVDYQIVIEETALPPGLIEDIVEITASKLTILKIFYDFYKEVKKKKGRMIIRMNQKESDLEDYNIEELNMKLELEGQPTQIKDE